MCTSSTISRLFSIFDIKGTTGDVLEGAVCACSTEARLPAEVLHSREGFRSSKNGTSFRSGQQGRPSEREGATSMSFEAKCSSCEAFHRWGITPTSHRRVFRINLVFLSHNADTSISPVFYVFGS